MLELRGVPGYPGYLIGHDGVEVCVWSCWSKKARPSRMESDWHKINPFLDEKYMKVSLSREGKPRPFRLHVVVAMAFLGPKPERQEVCHGPKGKLCNLPSNLSYGTRSENQMDRVRDGTHNRGERCGSSKIRDAQIPEIFSLREQGKLQREIAERYGVAPSAISNILNGRRWAHIGTTKSPA